MLERFTSMTLLVVTCSLLLTGCWDRVEVNDLAVVVATSIDKDEEDGMYRFSVQVPLVSAANENEGGGGEPYYVDSAKGRTLREAITRLQRRMSRRLIFSHRRVMIIGEDVAKEGIGDFFDQFARLPDNRLTAKLIIAKGKGVDLMQATPHFDAFSSESLREISQLPFMIEVNMKNVAQILSLSMDPIIPYVGAVETEPKSEQKEVEYLGYAQFKNDRMVGLYEANTANAAHWFQPSFKSYNTTFRIKEDDPDGFITIEIYGGTKSLKIRMEDDQPILDMHIHAKGAIEDNMSSENLRFKQNGKKAIRLLEQNIKENIEAFITQAKKEKTDSGHWGLLFHRTYPRLWKEDYAEDWEEKLQSVTVNIQVDAEIERLGQVIDNITEEVINP